MATETPSGIAELKVNGAFYGGWKSMRATRSIEQMAGSFELSITERWPGHPESSPIKAGAACQLLLDGVPVITGYVDEAQPSYEANNHNISVTGRDKTGDLVDCSAIYKSGQWKGVRLEQLCRDLLAPFGIKLVVEVETGTALNSFNIQEGETVFECLDRAARMKGLLLTSNALGELVITRAGRRRINTALVEGQNILRASGNFGWKDRYSKYFVKGQERLGPDGESAETRGSPKGVAADPGITRYRPLVVLAEEHGASLQARADWERNVRQGRGSRGTITVQGWSHAGGLWMPNYLVPAQSPWLWLDAEMLITECSWSMGEDGSTTDLTISRPEAFELLPSNGTKGKGKGKKDKDWSML